MTIKEPLNSWTNAAYLACGIAVACQPTFFGALVGGGLCTLAIGSFLFHATGRPAHQKLDELGMYATFVPLSAMALGVLVPLPALWIVYSVALTAALGVNLDRVSSFHVLGLLVAVIFLGLAVKAGVAALLPLGLFALAFLLRHVDHDRGHGRLHAAWHILTAAAILLVFFQLA